MILTVVLIQGNGCEWEWPTCIPYQDMLINYNKQHSLTNTGTAFFGNRVINVWNNLSHDTVDFSTVNRFKSSLIRSDLSEFLQYD